MRHAPERNQRRVDESATGLVVQLRDQAKTAGIAFIAGVVQSGQRGSFHGTPRGFAALQHFSELRRWRQDVGGSLQMKPFSSQADKMGSRIGDRLIFYTKSGSALIAAAEINELDSFRSFVKVHSDPALVDPRSWSTNKRKTPCMHTASFAP